MKKILMILMVLCAGVSLAWAANNDPISEPKYPRYELKTIQKYSHSRSANRYRGNSVLQMDIDGDGQNEFINSNYGYISAEEFSSNANVRLYQKNLPPQFEGSKPLHSIVSMVACTDLDGDGRENLIVWGNTPDGSLWRFWNLDPATGRTISEFDLAGGEDFREDGKWDGLYYVTGSVPVMVEGREIPALIIGCTVGYDRYNRRIMAVDPSNGDILWSYGLGPNPFFYNTRIADLDGDDNDDLAVGAFRDGDGGTNRGAVWILFLDDDGTVKSICTKECYYIALRTYLNKLAYLKWYDLLLCN